MTGSERTMSRIRTREKERTARRKRMRRWRRKRRKRSLAATERSVVAEVAT